MNTNKQVKSLYLALPPHQEKYLKEHGHCVMCETRLEIHHEINTKELKVKEEAYCPTCGIRARTQSHLMH